MEQSVEFVIKETITEVVNVDHALAERVRELVNTALDWAEFMMNYGLADQKMAMIRTLLNASTKSLGKDFTTHDKEAKLAVDRLFESMREVEAVDAPPLVALTPRTDDSDEGPDD
jgi:hypothetical protein